MNVSFLKRSQRFLPLLFFLPVILKILLVGFDIDEQYAVTMSFRLLKGDFPIIDMWEPHQTSCFFCALCMAPYLALTKSTAGIFLYLRIVGLIIHLCIFFLLRHFLLGLFQQVGSKRTASRYATCISGIFFFTLPKLMFLPDFSNLQMWFLLLTLICLLQYYTRSPRLIYLTLAGICLTGEVLIYPSTILVFGTCAYCIIHFRHPQDKQRIVKEALAFTTPCLVGFLLFVGYLLYGMSPGQLLDLLSVISKDGSHSIPLGEKIFSNLQSCKELLLFAAVYATVAFLVLQIFKKQKSQLASLPFLCWEMLFLICTLLGQTLIWILGDRYPNYPHAEYVFLPLLTLFQQTKKEKREPFLFSFFLVVPAIAFFSILLFTNHPLIVSTPFLGGCAVGGLTLAGKTVLTGKTPAPLQKLFQGLLLLWLGTLLFGNLFLVRTTGGQHYTIFDSVSLIRQGPATCIAADTETVKNYKAAQQIAECLPSGSNVFYAGKNTVIYLQSNLDICTPSTISSPTFDEKVSFYFSLHPDKLPEYVICDSNLPELSASGWLSDYLRSTCETGPLAENDFFVLYKVRPSVAAP